MSIATLSESTIQLSDIRPYWQETARASKPDLSPCVPTPEFGRLGVWGEKIRVAKPGAMISIVHWLAINRQRGESHHALWQRCLADRSDLFTDFQTVSLDKPSFFLPAEDVTFTVARNPSQIPDNPPRGVLLRHWEAMEQYPRATHFYLEPIFTLRPELALYTGDLAREDAAWDERDAIFAARLYGPILRVAQWSCEMGRFLTDAGKRTYDHATRIADQVWHRVQTRRLRRRALRYLPPDRARQLSDEELWFEEKRRRKLQQEIEHWRKIDPILCFSLPDVPHELRFTAHWFHGTDGRTYMHV